MTALNAPRDLNEFETCSDSSLSETSAPARSDSHAEAPSGVRRTYGAIRRRARKTSTSRKDIRQLMRERGSRQDFADAGLSRGVDHDRSARATRSRRSGSRRAPSSCFIAATMPSGFVRGVVQVENHERRRRLAHLRERGVRRARERDGDAELARGRLDLRAEHQVVENGEYHGVIMIIESQAVGPFFKNGFVVGCEETREAVLIDPGDEVETLLAFAERQSLAIRHILLTHAHVDHVTGVAAAKRALDVPVYLHRDDLFLYERAVESGAMFGLSVEPQPPIDVFYTPGQVIAFGSFEVRAHHTPGHCPGRRVSADRQGRRARQGPVRRRHALRRARSAARICRAAITRRSSRRSATCCFAFGDDAHRASRPRPGYDHRPGTPHQPVSDSELTARGGQGSVFPCLPPPALSSCASRSQLDASDAEAIACAERRFFHALVVDEGAVRAREVHHFEPSRRSPSAGSAGVRRARRRDEIGARCAPHRLDGADAQPKAFCVVARFLAVQNPHACVSYGD